MHDMRANTALREDSLGTAGAPCLQAAQRKALDVINSVGLSDSLLRVIDRRQRMDCWITYGGMVRRVL